MRFNVQLYIDLLEKDYYTIKEDLKALRARLNPKGAALAKTFGIDESEAKDLVEETFNPPRNLSSSALDASIKQGTQN